MSRPRDPPKPDLSRTFWTPPFPSLHGDAIRRKHPILRYGDYNPTTGLYIWQNRRCEDSVSSAYLSKTERALTGMWYGLENDPRCNHCEKTDRACTRVTNDVYGGSTCARCRLNSDRDCSFTHGGGRDLGHKRRRLSIQDGSDDDLPVKTILGRRKTNNRHDVNTTKVRSEAIEIPESPTFSPLFCTPSSTPPATRSKIPSDNQHKNTYRVLGSSVAQIATEGPPINAPKGPRAMREGPPNSGIHSAGSCQGGQVQIEERLRALEAENDRYKKEARKDRDRVLELEKQIALFGQKQDLKLKQEIRELRSSMNHAINQTIQR